MGVNKVSEEQKKTEQKKKELYYDPNTCAFQDEPGCAYPDCDNCGVCYDDENENW